MTSRDFCYWLQGYFEIKGNTGSLTEQQVSLIQAHLHLVFAHEIDPQAGGPPVQEKLNSIHSAGKRPPGTRC